MRGERGADAAITTKSPGAILSANPKGVNLKDEANKKVHFLGLSVDEVFYFCEPLNYLS